MKQEKNNMKRTIILAALMALMATAVFAEVEADREWFSFELNDPAVFTDEIREMAIISLPPGSYKLVSKSSSWEVWNDPIPVISPAGPGEMIFDGRGKFTVEQGGTHWFVYTGTKYPMALRVEIR